MWTRQVGPGVPLKYPDTHNTEDAHDIRSALCNLLDRIKSGGSFVTAGVYPEAPLPALSLRGYGPIPLPLAYRDAGAICEERTDLAKKLMPGIQKSIDRESGKHLHNQWEMKSDGVTIRNPAWNKFVRQVAVKVTSDLGIVPDASKVKVEFDRFRLWAVGACIPSHKHVPKKLGRFGKLLICLPAPHQGGDLLFTYDREAEVSTEASCLWKYSYVAWYADVTLEFKPLDSGYRLMLEYDLILPSPAKLPSAAHLISRKSRLRDLLVTWNGRVEKDKATKNSTFPTLLAYVCDSYYEDQPLSLNVLQGKDRRRAICLGDTCSQIDMGLYIADLDRTRSGFCEESHPSYCGNEDGHHDISTEDEDFSHCGNEDGHHDISTEDEDLIVLTQVVNLEGTTVASDLVLLLEDNFVQSEPFDEDDPDDEDYENHHGHVTHYYRKTVLVVIPSVAKREWLPQESKERRPNKRKRGVEVIDLE